MDLGIKGRRAAVAGASSGLGLGSARALAAAGVHVAICGRDPARLQKAAASIEGNVTPIVADVSEPEGAQLFVQDAQTALGGIDILVPNAGGPPAGNFESTALEAYPLAISLNLLSVIAMCKEAVPAMQGRGWGRVVAITSNSVRQPYPNLILSNTARAGTTGFLKTLASEVAKDGVTVNSIQPGVHRTARVEALMGDLEVVMQTIPTRTVGEPEDFGRAVAFLCSESARFINGVALPVDGGAYAGLQ